MLLSTLLAMLMRLIVMVSLHVGSDVRVSAAHACSQTQELGAVGCSSARVTVSGGSIACAGDDGAGNFRFVIGGVDGGVTRSRGVSCVGVDGVARFLRSLLRGVCPVSETPVPQAHLQLRR
jgi:hypothetical protein